MLHSHRSSIASAWGCLVLLLATCFSGRAVVHCAEPSDQAVIQGGALDGEKLRVVVSSDIGGTDPDDFQSMVHLLLYADVLELEGLISSPFGPGRKEHILQVIDCYEKDYPALQTHSKLYPNPETLRKITKQGAIDEAPLKGFAETTEGSQYIVDCARRDDDRPLYLLVWGGIDDLAQALHDAPEILPKLRVYWIGGPNKKWSTNAYQYIATEHPTLWMIEANDTYRGWFVGGNQTGEWENSTFVAKHVTPYGALGEFFGTQLGGKIKMGDTPSVAWLLRGNPSDPSQPSWGGQFTKAWTRPYLKLDRLPQKTDKIEVFGILEITLAVDTNMKENARAELKVENQTLIGEIVADGKMMFRFCPKSPKEFEFEVSSNVPSIDKQTGSIAATIPPIELVHQPDSSLPNWWTDLLDPQMRDGTILGAKTVSRWREAYLTDFADRMKRCVASEK